jgi:hypothetical protein
VLAAAEGVDLAEASETTIAEALTCWHLPTTHSAELVQWWETYCARQVEWRVAIAALGKMIPANSL